MAELASYVGIVPRTIITTAAAVGRGLRVTKQANGLCSVSADTVRGDFVTLHAIAASEAGAAASMSGGGKVVAYAGEASCDAGDPAYAFAGGMFGVTSTNTALLGKWATTTAVNTLGEVELYTVA